MHNILTIDVEDWKDRIAFSSYYEKNKSDSNLLQGLENILELCEKRSATGTFFLLGKTIEEHPEIPKLIHERGHECASHGFSHTPINRLTVEQFKDELERTSKLIKKSINHNPVGFRAPRFSLNFESSWYLKILKESGFKYDSSLYPAKSGFYGIPKASSKPYRISAKNFLEHDPESAITEYPIAVASLGSLRLPLKFRYVGAYITNKIVGQYNKKGIPAVIYTHPWENAAKVLMNSRQIMTQIRNYRIPCLSILDKILEKNTFVSFKEFRNIHGF